MSWILGIISDQISSDFIQIISKIHPPSIHHFQNNQIYLASGGISDTCLTGYLSIDPKSRESGWMTVGLGIERKEASCRFLKASDWQTLLSKKKPDLSYIDGHFVAIRWQNGIVECFSDQFGLRTLYILRLANSVIFTTRLDWVALLTGKSEIDFEQFGSHWLTFNQLSYGCLVKGIQRLGPGGVAICKPTSIEIHNTLWLPNFSPENSQPLEQTLSSLLNPEIENDSVLSLGLSGGLDSRLLLACLLAKSKNRFSLHLFGHSNEPDVKVAQQIANDYHLDQHYFPESIPEIGTNLIVLREYIAKTCLTTPVSSWLKLRFYPELNRMNRIMIDGGMGEIARRQFLNRLYWKGRRKLLHDSPVEIFRYIQSHRASIFNSETINVMRRGVNQQLISMRDEMPPVDKIGVEIFLTS